MDKQFVGVVRVVKILLLKIGWFLINFFVVENEFYFNILSTMFLIYENDKIIFVFTFPLFSNFYFLLKSFSICFFKI